MADTSLTDAPVDENGRTLPESIRIGSTPRITPNELRLIKAQTGASLEGLMNDPADAMQVMIYLRLLREGYKPTWDEAGDVAADLSDEPPDPSKPDSSTTSPPSVASGG